MTEFEPDAPADTQHVFGMPHGRDEARTIVIPVPFDATASYRRGAMAAPAGVRSASHQVDLHHIELGEVWRHGVFMEAVGYDPVGDWNSAATRAVDRYRLDGDPDALAEANRIGGELTEWVQRRAREVLDSARIPAVLGGDHSVALGAIRAGLDAYPEAGVLQIDAHLDLRPAYEGFEYSHASVMYNLMQSDQAPSPLVQVGVRDVGSAEWAFAVQHPSVVTWSDRDLMSLAAAGQNWLQVCENILESLPDDVWISIDVDGLDPALCPNTGTPVPGGLGWGQLCMLLTQVYESGRRIIGFDLCEVGAGEWDCIVGARILYELAALAACSQAGEPSGEDTWGEKR